MSLYQVYVHRPSNLHSANLYTPKRSPQQIGAQSRADGGARPRCCGLVRRINAANTSSMRGGSGGFPAVAIKRAAARCGVRRTAAPVASASTAPLPACPPSLRYCVAPSLARGLPASRPAGAGPCLRLRRSALRSCPQPLSAALRAVAAGVRAGPPSAVPAESGGVPSAPPPSGPAGARKRAHVSLCVPLGVFCRRARRPAAAGRGGSPLPSPQGEAQLRIRIADTPRTRPSRHYKRPVKGI